MKIYRYLLLFFLSSIHIPQLIAQTNQNAAETNNNQLVKTNTQLLQKDARDAKKAFKKNHRSALRFARQNNLPVRKVEANGKITALQSIDKTGQPRYLTTFTDPVKSVSGTEAAITTSTNQVWEGGSLNLGLSGSSSNVTGKLGIWDGSGVLTTHRELSGRVTQQDQPESDADGQDHATHVSGIMIGAGLNPRAKGMAYKTTLKAYDWNNDISEITSAAAAGLLLSNHSYGLGYIGWVYNTDRTGTIKWEWHGNTAISTTEDYRFGYYDDDARQVDRLAFNAPNILMVFAAGNDRTSSGPDDGSAYYLGFTNQTSTVTRRKQEDYDLLSSTGVAKNVLTVGAVASIAGGYETPADVSNAYFSNWGPTDDGRIKPDLVGDGVNIFSSVATANDAYAIYSGTSMAAPNVTGSLLLLQEHYANLHQDTVMRSATLKGLAIHTADEAGSAPGPDYSNGWGLLNTAKAAAVISDSTHTNLITERTLTQGETYTLPVIASGTEPIRATISWTDPAATPLTINNTVTNNRTARLINDLDLSISDTTNAWLPWVLNPEQPQTTATTGDNVVDNVEQVLVANPVAGATYQVVVKHKGTLTNNSQPYSLILSGIGGQAYCVSAPTLQQGARIASVKFGTINNTPENTCTTYSDFTRLSTELYIGSDTGVQLTIKLGTCDYNVNKIAKVFIDWNNDFDFEDTSELVYTSGVIASDGTFTTTVLVPAGLMANTFTRMRIVCVETTNAADVNACGTYGKGETQDYSLQLVKPVTDVGITALVSPTSDNCVGAQKVKVRLKNFGSKAVISIPVTAVVQQNNTLITTLTGTYADTLSANREAELELNGSFAATAGLSYTITITSNLPADGVVSNNSFTATVTLSATEAPVAQAVNCGSGQVSLRASGAGTAYWYDAPIGGNLLAVGNQTTTTTIPASQTYYAALNSFYGTLGPATKSVFGGGTYGGGYQPMPLITTSAPVVLDSARLYIGYPGKLTFTVETATDSIVSSTTIAVKATRTTPVATDAADDPNDQGAMYPLKLVIPQAGSYHIRLTYEDGATIFRSNVNVSGYPFTLSPVISLTGALYNGSPITSSYYYFYNLKVKALDCPSERVAVVAQPDTSLNATVQASGPTTICQGDTVTLSVPAQNGLTYQWQKDGIVIPNATAAVYQATQSGNYTVTLSNNICTATPDAIQVTTLTVPKPTISLQDKTLTSSAATGNQWYLNGMAIANATDTAYVAKRTGDYTVTVTQNGCSSTSDPVNVYVPIIRDLTVYPNPATGNIVNIRYTSPGSLENIQVKVFDMIGKIISEPALEQTEEGLYEYEMSLTNFAGGIYIIRITDENQVFIERFVKLK